jgi:hypothetical protein
MASGESPSVSKPHRQIAPDVLGRHISAIQYGVPNLCKALLKSSSRFGPFQTPSLNLVWDLPLRQLPSLDDTIDDGAQRLGTTTRQ